MTNEELLRSISLEGEEWRDVVGYEGMYLVSNYARVLSVKTEVEDKLRIRKKEPKLLSIQHITRNGKPYCNVRLYKNKRSKLLYLHRIVAEAFISNPQSLPEVDHIDTDGRNNLPSNLRWCTHKMNQNNETTRFAMSTAQQYIPKPEKWKSVVRLENGTAIKVYNRLADVELDGFSRVGVIRHLKGKTKHSGGFQWMYLSDYESLINKSKNSLPAPNTAD